MIVRGAWLTDARIQRAFALLLDAGHQAFAVGGCVRNALLEEPVNDVDLCTDALPQRVLELAQAAGIKAIPTGIDHGTVTLAIDGEGIEVTTFRQDVETDGRRAVVAFTDDIAVDARRRDFTINAIYADQTGGVVDPLGGLADIPKRKIRFIDDAEMRIREDALRILRFFRFYAAYGDPMEGPDADGLAACAAHIDLLGGLSDERIGTEIRKLLGVRDPGPALASMAAAGVLGQVMPGASAAAIPPLVDVEAARAPRWLRRLGQLGGLNVSARLKLSKAEIKALAAIADTLERGLAVKHAAYLYGELVAIDAALIAASMSGAKVAPEVEAAKGASLEFPVKARMLMPPLKPGPKVGEALERLRTIWIESDFSLSEAQLLALL